MEMRAGHGPNSIWSKCHLRGFLIDMFVLLLLLRAFSTAFYAYPCNSLISLISSGLIQPISNGRASGAVVSFLVPKVPLG